MHKSSSQNQVQLKQGPVCGRQPAELYAQIPAHEPGLAEKPALGGRTQRAKEFVLHGLETVVPC